MGEAKRQAARLGPMQRRWKATALILRVGLPRLDQLHGRQLRAIEPFVVWPANDCFGSMPTVRWPT